MTTKLHSLVALIKIIIATALDSLVALATALDSLVALIKTIFTKVCNDLENVAQDYRLCGKGEEASHDKFMNA